MPTFLIDKLVRDEYPRIYEEEGQVAVIEVLQGKELVKAQMGKLDEELAELAEADGHDAVLGELADVSELLACLAESGVENNTTKEARRSVGIKADEYGITREEIADKQAVKNKKVGSFRRGQKIVQLEVQESSEWTQYYRDKGHRELE